MNHINITKLYNAFGQEDPLMLIELLEAIVAKAYASSYVTEDADRIAQSAEIMIDMIRADFVHSPAYEGVNSCEVFA